MLANIYLQLIQCTKQLNRTMAVNADGPTHARFGNKAVYFFTCLFLTFSSWYISYYILIFHIIYSTRI